MIFRQRKTQDWVTERVLHGVNHQLCKIMLDIAAIRQGCMYVKKILSLNFEKITFLLTENIIQPYKRNYIFNKEKQFSLYDLVISTSPTYILYYYQYIIEDTFPMFSDLRLFQMQRADMNLKHHHYMKLLII